MSEVCEGVKRCVLSTECVSRCRATDTLASFPGLRHIWLHEERRGPDIYSHMRDVKGSKVVERT